MHKAPISILIKILLVIISRLPAPTKLFLQLEHTTELLLHL